MIPIQSCCSRFYLASVLLGVMPFMAYGSDIDIGKIAISVAVILFSASFHEASHALVAYKLGDSTGHSLGRITLNPIPHIDPLMSIIFPAMTLIISNGSFTFGGAKPVPINPYNFKKPASGFALSAAAGPVANIVLAVITIMVWYVLWLVTPEMIQSYSLNAYLFGQMLVLNIVLAIFNLIPIPPLDGSRVFRLLLPYEIQQKYDMMERFGFLVLLAAILLFDIGKVVGPFLYFAMVILSKLFGVQYVNELQDNLMNL